MDQPAVNQANSTLNSPFADQRRRGFSRLRFNPFVEAEFLRFYAQSTVQRARMMPLVAMVVTLIAIGVMLADGESNYIMLVFDVLLVLPLLGSTLYASTNPRWHRIYQLLLAISALMIGLWCTSIVTRASMQGTPYYFAAEIAWLFLIWLILGLPFRHAAAVSLTMSFWYILGNLNWNFNFDEIVFGALMLIFVNALGAYCCYQLEHTVRQSYLDTKVLGELAERDGLTGLYNRRSYDAYLRRIWRQSRREQAQITVMLIDIDHFKAFNDFYGHQAGDDALKTVANVIGNCAKRPLDFAARFGGEEFGLILYGSADEYGRELPDQLREAVRNCKISHDDSPTDQYLTVSIGVAMMLPDAKRSLDGAVQMADEALYQAKEDGRNKVVLRTSTDIEFQTGRFRAREKAATA